MKKLLLGLLSVVLVSSVAMAAEAPAMPAPYPMPPPAPAPGSVPAAPAGTVAVPTPAQAEAAYKERAQFDAQLANATAKVKAGCAADVKATGCNQDMNRGFTKCLSEYIKAHPEYKISESCASEARALRKNPTPLPMPPRAHPKK